jgi:hypothetical protein|tara:strand:+ start:2706 stop:3194 length:489 start_codon:yes stop_codon:yes gene_type:complete
MYLKNTYKKLSKVGFMIVKGLRQELKDQQHNATHKLSNSLKPKVKGKSGVMDIITSKLYWKAVNNPAFAKPANINEIKKWLSAKGLPISSAPAITKKLKNNYGKPYVYWTEGNNLRRTDFAGHTARKFSAKVAVELAPAIGQDVADMIKKAIKKNIPKAKTI